METFIIKLALAAIPLVILVASVTTISSLSTRHTRHPLARHRTLHNILRALAGGVMLR
ncbi:hypothetical protein [Geobacter sp. FeAm09]|uniref:hypothetical protein n=1 Tax=Geobacter sp. FeAm09 TaxID=2597769 RepID=UPI00143DC2EA|nr:hypothetical protein [Geobacter sp. FeAm09]